MQWFISNYCSCSCEILSVYTFEPSLCCLPEARWVDGEDGKCSTRRDVERLPLAQTSKLATNISISNHNYLDTTLEKYSDIKVDIGYLISNRKYLVKVFKHKSL